MPALLSATAAKALAWPVETTLSALLDEYEFDREDRLLTSLTRLQDCFSEHGLVCLPPIGQGELSDSRVLTSSSKGSLESALIEIGKLETASVEFKSSLVVDRRRLLKDPGRPLQDYKSESVLRSALKTIAAFTNSGGGTLYVGVEDGGVVCGLSEDFGAIDKIGGGFDSWDLTLRNHVKSRFSSGQVLNSYIQTSSYETDMKCFVKVKVAPRKSLTFLKTGDVWELFVRTGTQTNSIPYCDIEEHFALSRRY